MQVDHINIVCSDIERSRKFYVEVLGCVETRRARLEGDWIEQVVGLTDVCADVVYVQPPDGGPRIELIQYHIPAGTTLPDNALANTIGLRHIAFRIDDMAGMRARLEEAGVEFIGAPVRVPGNVVRHDAGQKTLCYFNDPDGVLLELAEYA